MTQHFASQCIASRCIASRFHRDGGERSRLPRETQELGFPGTNTCAMGVWGAEGRRVGSQGVCSCRTGACLEGDGAIILWKSMDYRREPYSKEATFKVCNIRSGP